MNKKKVLLIASSILVLGIGFFAIKNLNSNKEFVKVRIGTYNIDSKDNPNIDEMVKVFKENELDIIGVQEVDMMNTRNNFDMMDAFKGEDYKYIDFARGRDFANGEFGVGFVSKYEFKESEYSPIDSTGGKATKTCERVLIEKDGKEIAIYNTHLSFESLELRRRQIKEIIDKVNADPTSYKVITGDFNTDQNKYEYSMFLDNFNIANGKDGNWYDTFRLEDPDMKVFTVDNVIATKNMRITDVEMVDNDLSDHNLLFAEFELLDKYEGEGNSNNLALGQEVIASSTEEGLSAYEMVDYSSDTEWKSTNAEKNQTVILELDRVYNLDKIKLSWGEERAKEYKVLGSLNGIDYEEIYSYEGAADKLTDEIDISKKPYKFLKFDLIEGKEDIYAIKEIMVFGEKAVNKASDENLIRNGDFEEKIDLSNWSLSINDEDKTMFKLNQDDSEKISGNNSITISKINKDKKATGMISQKSIKVEANTTYKLSFSYKANNLTSDCFGIDLIQKDKDGKEIKGFITTLNDNFNIKNQWKECEYTFITSAKIDTLDLNFKILNGEGTLWIDNVEIYKVG